MKYLIFFFLSLLACHTNAQQYATCNGVQLSYRTFGKGEPLLIINGGPGMNSDGFTDLAVELSKNYMTILFDQRGTGLSVLPVLNSSTISMDLMTQDIECLRKSLKIERWSILGHSFGGMLGSYYTVTHPTRVNKLILSSSGGIDLDLLSYVANNISNKITAAEQKQLDNWNRKISNGDTSLNARLQRGKALAPAYVYDRKHIPLIALRLTQGNSVINNLVWSDLRRIQFDCTTKAKGFKKPVLIIQGRQDIVEKKTAEKAAAAFTNSRVVFLNNCVHYGWLDAPVEYYKEIRSFLAS